MTQMTLTVERSPVPQLSGQTVCFGNEGGTLGRSTDCTLVLPDPDRVTSSMHARIEFSAGSFLLVDTSTNGTYHKLPTTLIGKNRRVTLADGDRVYIGDFVLRVDIDDGFPAEPSRAQPPMPEASQKPPTSAGASASSDDSWDLDEFSAAWGDEDEPAASPSSKSAQQDDEPERSYTNSPEREFFSPPSSTTSAGGEVIPDDWDDFLTGFHGAGESDKAAPQAPIESPPPPPPPPDSPDLWPEQEAGGADEIDPLDALIDPPGLSRSDADSFPPPESHSTPPHAVPSEPLPPIPRPATSAPIPATAVPRPAASVEASSLSSDETHEILRAVTRGLMALLQSRSEIKNEFRISQTRFAQTENNPLKFSPDADEALKRVLGGGDSQGFLTGARAFEDALKDIQAHQLAILSAVQRAIESSISQFDPVELEKKLQRISPISAKTPGLKAAKCWNLFTVHYDEVAGRMRDDARQLFLTEFAEAYEEASNALVRGNRQEP